MTANYLRFLAFLVSGSYAPVVLMPRVLRYINNIVHDLYVIIMMLRMMVKLLMDGGISQRYD
jgi:hypothetical protein